VGRCAATLSAVTIPPASLHMRAVAQVNAAVRTADLLRLHVAVPRESMAMYLLCSACGVRHIPHHTPQGCIAASCLENDDAKFYGVAAVLLLLCAGAQC
jgi:hypothetical protein